MTDQSTVERFEHKPRDFIGAAWDGRLVYVGVADRDEFDKIAAPCVDHGANESGHVLTKTVGNHGDDEVTIIFQYWIKNLTPAAMRADTDARLAAKSADDRDAATERAA